MNLEAAGSGQRIRFPDGPDGHPRSVLGTQIAENHIFCWCLRGFWGGMVLSVQNYR
jgi:hypothetical protein